MKIKCLIIDDEPLAIQLLEKYVQDTSNLVLAGTCSNALEAAAALRNTPVDLIFLDIQMPKISGLDLLKILDPLPAVIITTAYREYAMDGYDWNVTDYLLKPITFTRFLQAVEKYHKRYPGTMPPEQPVPLPYTNKWLMVQSGTKIYRFSEADILYIESLRDYICLYLNNGKKSLIKYQIGKLEPMLSDQFIRVHRSYIVQKQYISLLQHQSVTLTQGIIVPIGGNYREQLIKALE